MSGNPCLNLRREMRAVSRLLSTPISFFRGISFARASCKIIPALLPACCRSLSVLAGMPPCVPGTISTFRQKMDAVLSAITSTNRPLFFFLSLSLLSQNCLEFEIWRKSSLGDTWPRQDSLSLSVLLFKETWKTEGRRDSVAGLL